MPKRSISPFTYLQCPDCGTRYVARQHDPVDPFEKKPRWFTCSRCEKRVVSVAFATEHLPEQHV